MDSVEATAPIRINADTVAESTSPMFFPVSLTKLLVLSICTLGLYEIYWFYKNWQLVKRRETSDIVPALRALFTVLFCYSLFRRVGEESEKNGISSISVGPLAVGWIVTTVLWRLPDPYWLIAFLAVLFMLPIQHAANSINMRVAPGHDPNRIFSGWNIAATIIGGLFFCLAVVGTFLPPEQA